MILPILRYPDPRLRISGELIQTFNTQLKTLIEDMFETMYAAPGIGLAATQVNQSLCLIVLDISEDRNQPLCLINPEIIKQSGEVNWQEGCLSVPEYYEKINRSEHITVRALDKNGKTIEFTAEGLLSVCIQHEIDHLSGILFVDHLSKLKQKRLLEKIKKSTRLK
jgi:peptide deformylase